MVKRWRPYIVNYFVSRSTNGMSEGFNTKIKLIKRLAYGRLTNSVNLKGVARG